MNVWVIMIYYYNMVNLTLPRFAIIHCLPFLINSKDPWSPFTMFTLTHWGRVTHICLIKLTIIGSDNGLLPDQGQAIIWINAGFLSIGPLGTKFSEILIKISNFSFTKMHLKLSSAKWRPFCPEGDELTHWGLDKMGIIGQMPFSNAFSWFTDSNFTQKFDSLAPDLHKVSISSGNDWVPNRGQAIIWTNAAQDIWCHVASLGNNELTLWMPQHLLRSCWPLGITSFNQQKRIRNNKRAK